MLIVRMCVFESSQEQMQEFASDWVSPVPDCWFVETMCPCSPSEDQLEAVVVSSWVWESVLTVEAPDCCCVHLDGGRGK